MAEKTRGSTGWHVARIFFIAFLIALLLVLLPSPVIHSYAEILTLPIDDTGGIAPYDWGYTGDGGYEDASVSVRFEYGTYLQTDWTAVKVQIANPTQLRTLLAGRYGSTQEAHGAAMARRVKSVLAIGGDFFIYNHTGYIVRQGKFFRNRPNGEQDVLIIDREGNLHVLIRPDKQAIEAYEQLYKDSIVNAFTFGPGLVANGQRIEDSEKTRGDRVKAQRIALCQTGPLSYLVVYSDGPVGGRSLGLTLSQFADLVASFPGVITAYNLDGGSSATIVFRDEKVNGPQSQRSRSIGDIIYFAGAFVKDQEQAEAP